MIPILIAGPALEPVSLAEAKAWLRIDGSDEDALISTLVTSARLVLEAHTHQLFLEQSWKILYDAWPSRGALKIPLTPFMSLEALQVYDASGVASDVSASMFVLDASPQGARIAFTEPPPEPGRKIAGIEMRIRAGFGASAANVPAPLRQAILMLAARWFENRGDAATDATALPVEIAALVNPFRRMRLA